MDRRRSMAVMAASLSGFIPLFGCRGKQVGEIKSDSEKDLVGSHAAGSEVYKPLIEESLCKLLARQSEITLAGGAVPGGTKRICFVGLENKSSEDLGDFKAQIEQILEQRLNRMTPEFEQVSKRYTETALRETRLRPDELFLPAKQQQFLSVMQSQGMKFDYLLFATVTSGTTRSNSESQKDYLLTLDLIEISSGKQQMESASLRKGYHKSHGLR